jgi:flagellum-specific peptidoglycan hydrolase FlgJ
MTPEDFIAAIAPSAQSSALVTRIPASFVVAQGALESAWGISQLAQQGFNLFGVKADASWIGDTIAMSTREFINGKSVVVPALWRKYTSWLDCLNDHAAFLRNNHRYQSAFSGIQTGESFARAIAAAGYATDPLYAGKLIGIIRSHNLASLDISAQN